MASCVDGDLHDNSERGDELHYRLVHAVRRQFELNPKQTTGCLDVLFTVSTAPKGQNESIWGDISRGEC